MGGQFESFKKSVNTEIKSLANANSVVDSWAREELKAMSDRIAQHTKYFDDKENLMHNHAVEQQRKLEHVLRKMDDLSADRETLKRRVSQLTKEQRAAHHTGPGSPSAAAQMEAQVGRLAHDTRELRHQHEQLRGRYERTHAENQALREQLAQAQAQLTGVEGHLADRSKDIHQLAENVGAPSHPPTHTLPDCVCVRKSGAARASELRVGAPCAGGDALARACAL